MRIKELCEKYQVDKRTIDYLTNLDLIRFTTEENGYRDYGIEAEEDIKKLLIIDAMGITGEKRKQYFKLLDYLPQEEWDEVVIKKIEKQKEIASKRFNDALEYAKMISNKGD